jgi:hypothetical protein
MRLQFKGKVHRESKKTSWKQEHNSCHPLQAGKNLHTAPFFDQNMEKKSRLLQLSSHTRHDLLKNDEIRV